MRFLAHKLNSLGCNYDNTTVDAVDSDDALRILKRDAWTKASGRVLYIVNQKSGETDVYNLKAGRTYYEYTADILDV